MLLDRNATETLLIDLPEKAFVEVWCEVVGEVPAAIVGRAEMVDILLDTAGNTATD